jgi:hypothetical protein
MPHSTTINMQGNEDRKSNGAKICSNFRSLNVPNLKFLKIPIGTGPFAAASYHAVSLLQSAVL